MGSSAVDTLLKGREWLALRLIAISLPMNAVLWWMMDFVDRDHLFGEFPKWLQYVVILPVVAGFFGLGYLLLRGSHDLLVHVLPAGRFKHTVVGDDAANEQSVKEFPELGRVAAFAPLWLVGLYLVLLLMAGFALGGFAALSGIWSAVSGWPSWAVVITILLVMILFKQDKPQR